MRQSKLLPIQRQIKNSGFGRYAGTWRLFKKAHYEVGQAVADNKIDFLLAFGNDAKYIVDGAKENGMKTHFILIIKKNFQINFSSLQTRVMQ